MLIFRSNSLTLRAPATLLLVLLFFTFKPLATSAFSFSEYEDQETKQENASLFKGEISDLHCPAKLLKQRIATMIGEKHQTVQAKAHGRHGNLQTVAASYAPMVDELNSSFRKIGLHPLTVSQINSQIAQMEQEAVLNNDLDAALAASKKLQAAYLIKGTISSKSQVNKIVNVDEVYVTISLILTDSRGRQLGSASVSTTNFSDSDTAATIQNIVAQQADQIVYQLFHQYCRGK